VALDERTAARSISIDLVKQRLRLLQRLRSLEIEYERLREASLIAEAAEPDDVRALERLEREHIFQIRRLLDFDRVNPEIAPLFSVSAGRAK
jgi:hypothetical protein